MSHFSFKNICRFLPLLIFWGLVVGGCSDREVREEPVRVVELLPALEGGSAVLVEDVEASEESAATVVIDREAAPIARLRVTARGDAQLVRLSWKLAGEQRFMPYRALTFPVQPGEEERTYDVDLRREPYWTGQIDAIRFATDEGRLEIASVEGLPAASRHRLTSLKGLTVPSLPGSQRLEVELPPDLPREMVFETWLGLLPRFDQPGVTARFRAWVEPADGGEAVEWLDTSIQGRADAHRRGWRRQRQQVRVPAGGRLVLETTAERTGHPLPEGSAMWGAPVLVPESDAGRQGDAMNLLLVVVDTLRADVVGVYGDDSGGDGGGLTPNLDALADRSTRFDAMYAPTSWTLPSIATLLTGQQPQVHGAGRRIGDFAPTALGDALPTLAGELASHGYYTAGVYNNIYLNPSFGMERGFDEYHWVEDEDDVIVDHALVRLEELRRRPLFLFVHLFGPHHPYEPPRQDCLTHARDFAPDYEREPDSPDPGAAGSLGCSFERTDVPTLGGAVPAQRHWRWIEGLYRAEVAHTDRQVGRLLQGLEELGLASRTVVAVVSDHGEAFYDRLEQLETHGYSQADHGHTHFEELLRVPAMISVPGREAAVVAEPAELADVAPTLLGLLGLDPRGLAAGGEGVPASSRDLAPRMRGEAPTRHPTLISDRILYGPSRWAARRGPWKLVVPGDEATLASATLGDAPVPEEAHLATELYHLERDPGELRDVAGDHPDVVADLEELAKAELAAREELRRQLLGGDEDVLNSAYLEWNHITKLRALGYLK